MSHDFAVISIWLARVPSLFSLPASYLQSILHSITHLPVFPPCPSPHGFQPWGERRQIVPARAWR